MNETQPDTTRDDGKINPGKIRKDLNWAREYKRPFIEAAREDIEFARGKMWTPEEMATLHEQKVRPLTVNKIRPNIQLLCGIESQNRSDIKAYPEGREDGIEAEIASGLLKNLAKRSDLNFKFSDQFEGGITSGESWLEPYVDYENDPLFGELKWKKGDFDKFYYQPGAREYDLSDSRFLIKMKWNISKNDLLALYPKKRKMIEAMESGKVNLEAIGVDGKTDSTVQVKDNYGPTSSSTNSADFGKFDLVVYYYRKPVEQWYVADQRLGTLKAASSKAEAEAAKQQAIDHEAAEQQQAMQTAAAQGQLAPQAGVPGESCRVFSRTVRQIWQMDVVGMEDEPLYDGVCWSYPFWKSFPAMPYFCDRTTEPIDYDARDVINYGIVRPMKDLNRDFNKRRTQELRHLNQSANSGWLSVKGQLDSNKLQKFGGTPGHNTEWDSTVWPNPPMRLEPVGLSQGHAQMSAERSADIKEASGITSEVLAMESGDAKSGKAIALKQRQGMVMVQKIFDNVSQTKRLIGRFMLSMLGELYSVETAIRVMGEAFIEQNFSVPVMAPMMGPDGRPMMGPDGQPAQGPVIDPMTGQPKTQVDQQKVQQVFNQVLQDLDLTNYDVAVGETISSETLQLANYSALSEMASSGIPIPPQVLVNASGLSDSDKKEIMSAIQQAQAAAASTPPKGK